MKGSRLSSSFFLAAGVEIGASEEGDQEEQEEEEEEERDLSLIE